MPNKPVFIIAELSANHGGKLEIALDTVEAAKKAGADAIKIQTYTADTITIDADAEDFFITGGTLWDKQRLYDLYTEASLPWEWHQAIFDKARELDLVCFSTPFDHTAVDFLETLGNPIYKIASFEITDIPLISYAASKLKPMIISTGIATYEDIKLAIETCKAVGNNDITILKCTSSYPAPLEEANMALMQQFKKDFNVKIGLSDHTIGEIVPVVATVLGAEVIEKHFILDRDLGGPDAAFSMNVDEFTSMVKSVRAAGKAIGEASYVLTEKQQNGIVFSRSLYIVKDVKKGELLTAENVKSIRPGHGLHPKYYHELINNYVFIGEYPKGTRLGFDLVKKNLSD